MRIAETGPAALTKCLCWVREVKLLLGKQIIFVLDDHHRKHRHRDGNTKNSDGSHLWRER